MFLYVLFCIAGAGFWEIESPSLLDNASIQDLVDSVVAVCIDVADGLKQTLFGARQKGQMMSIGDAFESSF